MQASGPRRNVIEPVLRKLFRGACRGSGYLSAAAVVCARFPGKTARAAAVGCCRAHTLRLTASVRNPMLASQGTRAVEEGAVR